MDLTSLRTLRTEAEYEAALAAVRPYFDNEPDRGSDAAAHFDALVLLIENYEQRIYPIPRASPVEVLKFVMETNHYSRSDLIEVIGSKARVSDLLNGRREINLDQIRRISRAWNISPASLIADLAA
ncbi:type II toxin-antitoxin system HigA family antitoxin [Brevundimonas sp. R86498]|uniref:type II toxin-antitoxin system HigA family antitoxin n=1 Tax=Brevundimonas sp. R86498 TaxID=3093845 RepID=UPI0037C8653F